MKKLQLACLIYITFGGAFYGYDFGKRPNVDDGAKMAIYTANHGVFVFQALYPVFWAIQNSSLTMALTRPPLARSTLHTMQPVLQVQP